MTTWPFARSGTPAEPEGFSETNRQQRSDHELGNVYGSESCHPYYVVQTCKGTPALTSLSVIALARTQKTSCSSSDDKRAPLLNVHQRRDHVLKCAQFRASLELSLSR